MNRGWMGRTFLQYMYICKHIQLKNKDREN